MMMSQDPFETDLDALMQDYGAPIADAGFTKDIGAIIKRQAKLRQRLLFGAYALGGLIVGSQMDRIGDYWNRINNFDLGWRAPEIPIDTVSSGLGAAARALNGAATGGPDALIWIVSGVMGLSMIIWLAKDWLDGHI